MKRIKIAVLSLLIPTLLVGCATTKPVNDFFGSWLNIDGKMYCGYFLGYMVIRKLEKTLSMKQIAKLSENKVESMVMDALRSF